MVCTAGTGWTVRRMRMTWWATRATAEHVVENSRERRRRGPAVFAATTVAVASMRTEPPGTA